MRVLEGSSVSDSVGDSVIVSVMVVVPEWAAVAEGVRPVLVGDTDMEFVSWILGLIVGVPVNDNVTVREASVGVTSFDSDAEVDDEGVKLRSSVRVMVLVSLMDMVTDRDAVGSSLAVLLMLKLPDALTDPLPVTDDETDSVLVSEAESSSVRLPLMVKVGVND